MRVRVTNAGVVFKNNLIRREVPADRSKVLSKLLFVSGTHDHQRHRRQACKPIERDLRNCFIGLPCDLFNSIDDAIEMFLIGWLLNKQCVGLCLVMVFRSISLRVTSAPVWPYPMVGMLAVQR